MARLVAKTQLRAIVVGAGPAGLCAAAALSQDGHRVTVLERQPGLNARGNALVIQPAAVKAVSHITDAHDALRRVSMPNDELKWWSYGADKPFATSQAVDTRFDTDRVSVQKVFYDLAVKNGTDVRFGASVSGIQDGVEEAAVTTTDGETLQADVIIGADGIKSAIRKQLFSDTNTDPILTREAIFLAKIPGSTMRSSAALSQPFGPGVTYGIVGPERFVLGRWLQGDVFGVQYVDVNHGAASSVDGNWNTPGDLPALRKRFDDFRPSIGALLDATEAVEKWQIAYGPTLDTWQSPNGRIVLLGDAAHAMIPHAAQGLSQGIEDSVSLARILSYQDGNQVASALKRWVALRKPRADLFVQRSINNAALRSLPNGPAQQARDRKIAEMASKVSESTEGVVMDMHAEQNSPPFQKWMKEYDVVREVDEMMNRS